MPPLDGRSSNTDVAKGCGHSEAWLISGRDDLHLQHLVICMAFCPFHSAFAGSWPPLSNKLQCCRVLPTTVTLAFILLYLCSERLSPPATCYTFICVGLLVCLPSWNLSSRKAGLHRVYSLLCAQHPGQGLAHIRHSVNIGCMHELSSFNWHLCGLIEGMFIPGTLNNPQWWAVFVSFGGGGQE